MARPELGYIEGAPADMAGMFEDFIAARVPGWKRVEEREQTYASLIGDGTRYFCFDTFHPVRGRHGALVRVEIWSWVSPDRNHTLIRSTSDEQSITGDELSDAIRVIVQALEPFAARRGISVSMSKRYPRR